MRDIAVHEAPVAASPVVEWRTHARGLAIATCAALLFSLAGAFNTSLLPAMPRTIFWLIVMLMGALLGIGASTGMRAWGGLSHRPMREGTIVSLLIMVPQSLLVIGTTALFFGPRALTTDRVLFELAAVVSVTIAMTAMNYLTDRRRGYVETAAPAVALGLEHSLSDEAAAQSLPRLSDRLPFRLRAAPIRALEAEDHYVRVHTDAGSELLLLRLTDAIAELDGMQGARTHRSWWVAREAVMLARRSGGRSELVLADDTVVPISRAVLPVLQREGWFDN